MTQEVLKMALEALEDRTSLMKWQMARDAVKEALAQPEQKHPLQVKADRDKAWAMRETNCGCDHNEFCDTCWPVEFRKGGYWDQQEALAQHDSVQAKPKPEQEPVANGKLKVTLQDTPTEIELAQYKRMFETACAELGAINEALGLDPNDGGAEPILFAIEELKGRSQEPVAWMVYTLDGTSVCVTDNPADFTPEHRALPLYTTPPQRTWVGLMRGVRVEGDTVVISTKDNDAARDLCGALIEEMNK